MLKIRTATTSDVPEILKVHREAVFSKAADHYDTARLEAWSPGPTPQRIARVEQEIADPYYIVLIAESNSEIIGFAMAIPSKNELRALYVKPSSTKNVGKDLLAKMEQIAVKAGTKLFEFDASLNAEAFYEANGYIVTGRADHISGNGDVSAAVQMKKVLAL